MLSHSRRRWPYVLLLLLALAGIWFGVSGAIMAGSFKAAAAWPPPAGHEAYYDRVAERYTYLVVASLALLVGALGALWHRARVSARGRAAT